MFDLDAGPIWGFLGILLGSFVSPVVIEIVKNRTVSKTSKVSVETAEIAARPAMQQAIQDGFADLLHAQNEAMDGMREQVRGLTKRVEEQSALIEEMSEHISSLEAEIQKLGGIIPPRKRQKIDPAVA